MARSTKTRAFKVRQPVEFRFSTVPFEPLHSLRALDLERLARARHAVVELGQFDADCCKRMARAVIKKGRVTEIKVDACTDKPGKVSPEFARLFARAQSKLKSSKAPAPRLPMPVARFFRQSALGDVTIDVDVHDGMTCCKVCTTMFGTLICSFCCGTTPDDVLCMSIR